MAKNRIAYYPKDGKSITTVLTVGAGVTTIFDPAFDGAKIYAIEVLAITGAPSITLTISGAAYLLLPSTVAAAGTDLFALIASPTDAAGNKYMNVAADEVINGLATGAGTITVRVYAEIY